VHIFRFLCASANELSLYFLHIWKLIARLCFTEKMEVVHECAGINWNCRMAKMWQKRRIWVITRYFTRFIFIILSNIFLIAQWQKSNYHTYSKVYKAHVQLECINNIFVQYVHVYTYRIVLVPSDVAIILKSIQWSTVTVPWWHQPVSRVQVTHFTWMQGM